MLTIFLFFLSCSTLPPFYFVAIKFILTINICQCLDNLCQNFSGQARTFSLPLSPLEFSSELKSVQFSSVTQWCLTLCDPMDCGTPGLPVYHQLPEFTQTHVHWVSDIIQPPHPLLSPSPPTFNLSRGLFQWVSSLHQVAKLYCFSFSIILSNEYSGLIFFTMDWFDLLAVQGTLKNLLQDHRSKAAILQISASL